MIKFPASRHREQVSLKSVLVKKLVHSKCQGTCHNKFTVCAIRKELKRPNGGWRRAPGMPWSGGNGGAAESVSTERTVREPTTSVP